MRFRLSSGPASFYVYGSINYSRPSGTLLTRLSDGTITFSKIHRKRTMTFTIDVIHRPDLYLLLQRSNEAWIAELPDEAIYFRINGSIEYRPHRHFPEYFQASFVGEEL